MKKIHVLLSNFLLVALLLNSTTFAQEKEDKAEKKSEKKEKQKYEHVKNRTISQSYNVSASDKLNLKNQFGKLVIKTWTRNEVKVDIRIEVTSNDQERLQETFDNIDVKHGKDGNTVYFKTVMDKNKDKGDKKREGKNYSNTIDIDYEVSMPANLALNVEHQFGNLTIPDLTGPVDIEQQFGNLSAGKLSNPKNVEVRFGSAEIEGVNGGDYEFQFINNTAVIKNATGDIKVEVHHCKSNGVVIYAANTTSIDVDAQHSDVAIVVPKDMSAQFDVDTHFGSFKNNSSFTIKKEGDEDDDRRGPRFNYSYKGTSGGGKTKITLDGNFTDFVIGHEAPPAKPKKSNTTTTTAKKVRSV
ncbi:MAG TPA: hypothetical protein VFZ52_08475 [Chryseolinea sp.]